MVLDSNGSAWDGVARGTRVGNVRGDAQWRIMILCDTVARGGIKWPGVARGGMKWFGVVRGRLVRSKDGGD